MTHQRVDFECSTGIIESLDVVAHAVIDFRRHSALDCHSRRVARRRTIADCLKDKTLSLTRLFRSQIDSGDGVKRRADTRFVAHSLVGLEALLRIFERQFVVRLAKIKNTQQALTIGAHLVGVAHR